MGNEEWSYSKPSPIPKEAFREHSWYPHLNTFIRTGACELPNQEYAVVMAVLERLGYDSKALAGSSDDTTILEGNHARPSGWPGDEAYAKMSVPERTLLDLGGREFTLMTGSGNYLSDGNTLRMSLARNQSGANRLHITLGGDDLYTMRFFYYRSGSVKVNVEKGTIKEILEVVREVELYEGVFNSMLRELFESVTGLYTKMTFIKRSGQGE